MSPRMTPDQERAITALEGDLAIRAGAGSGKTTVLAHRFAHAVTAMGRGETAPLDRILTITFTSKAAAEIAERVRRVIGAEVSEAAARRTDEAWISTIHALCARLARRHVLEAGLDPYFAQADEMLVDELATEAFERALAVGMDGGAEVSRLLDAYDFAGLKTRVVDCHANVRTMGLDPRSITVPLDHGAVAGLVAQAARQAAELEDALASCSQTPGVVRSREALGSWRASLETCDSSGGDANSLLADVCRGYGLTRVPGAASEANRGLKDTLAQLQWFLGALGHAAVLEAFGELVRAFARHYSDVKRERGVLDFDDLQETALRVLSEHPQIAQRYRDQFELIMVDEFQDTNRLQMSVLAKLARENLCIVGDERQSIYGFRYADVEIFESLYRSVGERVELKANFRSHPGVLGPINALFSSPVLFGSEFMQLEARREGDGVVSLGEDEPRVECLLVGEEVIGRQQAREREAAWIAQRIDDLLADNVTGDQIAILLRASTYAQIYTRALEARGIPVAASAGVRLLDTVEAAEVMALLRAVCVPHDDVAMMALLAGRVVAAPNTFLLSARQAAGRGSLWSGLQAMAKDGGTAPHVTQQERALAAYVVNRVKRLAAEQNLAGLARFVSQACEAFDYDLTLHARGNGGARAWGNVLRVAALADDFEQEYGADAVEFVEHLKRLSTFRAVKSAPEEAESGAVRILTVHSAKGLEFPIVFVADLATGQSHSVHDVLVAPAQASSNEPPRVGLRLPEEPFGGARTPLFSELEVQAQKRGLEEEKRCLYVACTRARDLLVVSGATKLEKPADQCGGLIDWIRQVTGLPGSEQADEIIDLGGPLRVVTIPSEPTAEAPSAEAPTTTCAVIVPEDVTPVEPPRISHRVRPREVSYSGLHLFERCPRAYRATYQLSLGAFEPHRDTVTATQFGSAAHGALAAVMSGTPMAEALRVRAHLDELGAADTVRLHKAVEGFLESDTAAAIRAASVVGVERPILVPIGATTLVGSIDLVGWTDDHAHIVDYKTGAVSVPGVDREPGYLLQAQCYALAAVKGGARTVRVTFAFIEHPGELKEYEFSGEDEPQLVSRVSGIIEAIETSEFGRLDAWDAQLCSGCVAFGVACDVPAPDALEHSAEAR